MQLLRHALVLVLMLLEVEMEEARILLRLEGVEQYPQLKQVRRKEGGHCFHLPQAHLQCRPSNLYVQLCLTFSLPSTTI